MTTLRIATVDSLGTHVLQGLDSLRREDPSIVISLLTSNATVDLKKREAEIAVRMYRNEDEGLASLKLGSLGWSLYASETYLAGRIAGPGLLDGQRVIGYSESLTNAMAGASWIAAHAPSSAIRVHCSGPGAAIKIALTGLGVCVVPCYLAAGTPLKRLTDEVVARTDVYAVFLPERRDEPILGAAIEALFEMFDREYVMMSGEPPKVDADS
jgi:DNA-binding transcriptional LysR family regulator